MLPQNLHFRDVCHEVTRVGIQTNLQCVCYEGMGRIVSRAASRANVAKRTHALYLKDNTNGHVRKAGKQYLQHSERTNEEFVHLSPLGLPGCSSTTERLGESISARLLSSVHRGAPNGSDH